MYTFETEDNLKQFIADHVVITSEVAEIYGCSRQFIRKLVLTGKLHPSRQFPTAQLFWRPEVEARVNSYHLDKADICHHWV